MLCDCQRNLSILYIELTLSVLSERQITVELAKSTRASDGGDTELTTSVTMKPGEVPPTTILRAGTNPRGRGHLLHPHGRGNGKPVMVQ